MAYLLGNEAACRGDNELKKMSLTVIQRRSSCFSV